MPCSLGISQTYGILGEYGDIQGCCRFRVQGFQKIKGTFLKVPVIRIIVFWALHWGPPVTTSRYRSWDAFNYPYLQVLQYHPFSNKCPKGTCTTFPSAPQHNSIHEEIYINVCIYIYIHVHERCPSWVWRGLLLVPWRFRATLNELFRTGPIKPPNFPGYGYNWVVTTLIPRCSSPMTQILNLKRL